MIMAGSRVFQEEEEEEEKDQFFDSIEDVWPVFDSCPSSSSNDLSSPDGNSGGLVSGDPLYQIWVKNPDCVRERRDNFMRLMGWDLICSPRPCSSDPDGGISVDDSVALDIDRITSDGGAVLRSSGSENGSFMSSFSSEGPSTSEDGSSEGRLMHRITNMDDGRVFVANEFGQDGSLRSIREFGSNQMVTIDEFERSLSPSMFAQQLMQREDSRSSSNSDGSVRRKRIGWLRRLGAVACIVDRQGEEINSIPSDSDLSGSSKIRRVKTRSYRKSSKEFSAVFTGQDFKAHDGAILTMKFSPDGQYLASGGEDGVVRVWHVMACERTDEADLPEDDPSCIYFTVNHNSELAPLYAGKDKNVKRRTSDSACVVIPSDVFWIHEKPLHEFYGHQGDVLDLSWSKDKHLLSSSIDKTARLWRVGCDSCLRVFSHSNYVTCIQFNPIDENHFISGSIDGKVRIWEIRRCRVVDWIDIKEIVTAVCYRPDGKGGVVGTITGDCRFYDASDNHLQLEAPISLQGKKKSPNKRITGFQFCPSDRRKLMVTSADSQVRILDGVDVVGKYKGLRNTGGQISASFTSDGRHIVSASEDSNVYVWSHTNHDGPTSHHVKSTWSSERFFCSDASVAIPWNGTGSKNPAPVSSELLPSQQEVARDRSRTPEDELHHLSPSGSFTMSQEFFSEFLPKGSATWPEEKLPSSSTSASLLCRSHHQFLKASLQSTSNAWGQVIVTAGWDGRIRSFRNYGLPVPS